MPSSKRPIVNEDYNELIFIEPAAPFYEILKERHLNQPALVNNAEASNGVPSENAKQDQEMKD